MMVLMRSVKGQSNVVSALLLGGIILGGIISAYTWGMPILQKSQDRDTLQSSLDSMRDLASTIESIATRGGSQQASFNVGSGSLTIFPENDSIQYTISTSASYVSTRGWVPLNENEMKGIDVPGVGRGESYGILGRDNPGVVIGRADPEGDGFLTEYRLVFRELMDLQAQQGYQIDLVANGNLQASSGSTVNIAIEKGSEVTEQGASGINGPLVKREVRIGIE